MSNKIKGADKSGYDRWQIIHVNFIFWAMLLIHSLCIFAPFTFTWPAFRVAFGLYIINGFGITISYHRNLSHRSFDLPKWLEYAFAYCGALALQRDPIFWVSVHRYHHQFSDTERDPHSPIIHGFWFGHITWIYKGAYAVQKLEERKNVEDLKKQTFYLFLSRTYYLHPLAVLVVLYTLGGFPFFIWGGVVRTVALHQSTFLGNSIGHTWGSQKWNTGDSSKNNWLVNWLTFGEGWHNNHHAFEFSARIGLEWWELDPTWYVIWFLEIIGLATNVKVPTEIHKKKKCLSSSLQ